MRSGKTVRYAKQVVISVGTLYGMSIFILLMLALVAMVHEPSNIHNNQPSPLAKKIEQEIITSPFTNESFSGVEVKAKAYVVYDVVANKIIASSHDNDRLPLASITKVMTTLTALSLEKKKDDVFTIEPASIEDGYDLGLSKNQTWKLAELLKYMLIFSSNDAALTVAEHYGGKSAFVAAMNSLAVEYGLTATFTDPAGRDVGDTIGGLGTALDAAKLFILAKTQAPDILDATTKKRQSVFPMSGRLTGVPNTNQEIQNFPGAEGSKTGYTDLAGGNLGVIVDVTVGRPVVIVVLGSTKEGRFKDVDTLYAALLKSVR